MKSQRGVRLPTAPPTRKHGTRKYNRKEENPQNWKDYLDMERWEAQELADEMSRRFDTSNNEDGFWDEIAEQRGEREPVDDDYPTTEESETDQEVSD